MMLDRDMDILGGLPLLHLKSMDALACSDLHLGYEGVSADRGSFVPKVNLKRIKETMSQGIERSGATSVIVVGDIKNEFSTVHVEEFNEFREFMAFLREEKRIKKIELIKGNHDNFIDRYSGPLGFGVHRQEALIGRYLFFHGEEMPHGDKGEVLVMGHLHPSIAVYSKLGVKERIRCFLHGTLEDGRKLVVLPAMNYFAGGVEVNMGDAGEIAPIFKSMADIDEMKAIGIGEGEALDFGSVGKLRAII
jgi:uncharacterized protein